MAILVKLGGILSTGRGSAEALLADIAGQLSARGRGLAGIVQSRAPLNRNHPCDIDRVVAPDGPEVAIARQLGSAPRDCRLDPASPESASEAAAQTRLRDAGIPIANKFGAQECKGRGVCSAFGLALTRGAPLLTGVIEMNPQGGLELAGECKTPPAPDADETLPA